MFFRSFSRLRTRLGRQIAFNLYVISRPSPSGVGRYGPGGLTAFSPIQVKTRD